jgi:excisionase family DNA binding protein
MEETFLSIREAAEYLGISQHQVYKLSAGRNFPTYSPTGGRVYILKSDINDWIRTGLRAPVVSINSRAVKFLIKK